MLEIKGRVLRDQLGERLIEESGANFDADITKPFSNKPVRREAEAAKKSPRRPKFVRDGERRPIGEGGLIKNRKRREGSRDEALGKLSTSPDRSSGPERFGERGPRPERGGFGEGRVAALATSPWRLWRQAWRQENRTRAAADRAAEPAQGQRLDGAGRAADRQGQGGRRCRQGSRKQGAQGLVQAVLWQASRRKPFGKPRATGRMAATGRAAAPGVQG